MAGIRRRDGGLSRLRRPHRTRAAHRRSRMNSRGHHIAVAASSPCRDTGPTPCPRQVPSRAEDTRPPTDRAGPAGCRAWANRPRGPGVVASCGSFA
jgi:hypothetical protein